MRPGDRHLPHAPKGLDEDGILGADRTQFIVFHGRPANACTGYIAQERSMDIQQLQLLAGRIRDLVQQQSNQPIGHSQALDLIAALPGLRNWPEVRAFPKRVSSCELDESAVSRLAFRLKKKLGLDLSVPDVLDVLRPESAEGRDEVTEIWPSGPEPGVYVTTSQKAIDALLAKYEEATDGALIYAERAGSGWEGAIDLGEGPVWGSRQRRNRCSASHGPVF